MSGEDRPAETAAERAAERVARDDRGDLPLEQRESRRQGRTTRPAEDVSNAPTFEGRPLEGHAEDRAGRRRRDYPEGPFGHAPSTEFSGDADEEDVTSGAQAGAVAGTVAGGGLAGPIGGLVGAVLGGIAGAAGEVIDDPGASPGRVIREPYGHAVDVGEIRASAQEAVDGRRTASPPDAEQRGSDDEGLEPLT